MLDRGESMCARGPRQESFGLTHQKEMLKREWQEGISNFTNLLELLVYSLSLLAFESCGPWPRRGRENA